MIKNNMKMKIRARRYIKLHLGFTLVEALITIAVIAVIATIAIPYYEDYAERGRVTIAAVDINTMSIKIEQFYTEERRYPNSLNDIGEGDRLDPWDNPYEYTNLLAAKGKGDARKDKKLNPLNSDFDLFSKGKNGVFKTQISNKDSLDDVIRANDGRFVGLAKDY
jgi:general secretion pathway protein G